MNKANLTFAKIRRMMESQHSDESQPIKVSSVLTIHDSTESLGLESYTLSYQDNPLITWYPKITKVHTNSISIRPAVVRYLNYYLPANVAIEVDRSIKPHYVMVFAGKDPKKLYYTGEYEEYMSRGNYISSDIARDYIAQHSIEDTIYNLCMDGFSDETLTDDNNTVDIVTIDPILRYLFDIDKEVYCIALEYSDLGYLFNTYSQLTKQEYNDLVTTFENSSEEF